MKRNSVDDKRADRYLIVAVIIVIVTIFAMGIYGYLYGPNSPLSQSILITRFEKIEIKSTSVTKSTYIYNVVDIYSYNKVDIYFVTINFADTGTSGATIDSVLLNGVPYNDPGWTGIFKPVVFGDLTPKFRSIDVDESCSGIIEFSGDCKDPNGNKLIASGYDYYYVNVTIHTTGGKDYDTSVTLPQNPIPETSLSSTLVLAIAIVVMIALATLFIIVRRRARYTRSRVQLYGSERDWHLRYLGIGLAAGKRKLR